MFINEAMIADLFITSSHTWNRWTTLKVKERSNSKNTGYPGLAKSLSIYLLHIIFWRTLTILLLCFINHAYVSIWKNKLFKNISYFNIRTMGRQWPRFYRRFRLARISSYILKDPRVKTYYIYVWLSNFYVNMFTSIKVRQFKLRVLVFLKVHHGLDDLN